MRKNGPPPPGTARRLTEAEARIIGATKRWSVTTTPDGRVLILNPKTEAWIRLGPDGPVTEWSGAVGDVAGAARLADRLKRYWGETVYRVPRSTLERICAAADAALRGRIDRRELEWVSRLLDD